VRIILLCIYLFMCLSQIKAQQQSQDSLKQILETKVGEEKFQTAYQLGLLNKFSQPSSAIQYFSIIINSTTADQLLRAKSLQQIAGIYYRQGDFVKSKENYNDALTYFETLGQNQYEAEVLYSLGSIYLYQGNLAQSAEYYLKALRLHESMSNKVGMLSCYEALGNVYARQNNFTRSIEYTQKAITLYEQSANSMQALVAYESLGNAYLKTGNYIKASEYLNKALQSYKKLNNQAGIAYIYYQLGVVEQRKNSNSQAIDFFKVSKDIASKLNLQQILIQTNNGLANCYLVENKFVEATDLFTSNIKLAQKAGMNLELEEAYSGLERIYQLTSQTSKAKTFGTLSRDLRDSLYNDSMLKKLNDLQLNYEAEKQQREIDLLSKEQELRQTELLSVRKQNRIITFAAIVAFIFIVFLVVLYFQNKRIAVNLNKQTEELIRLNKVKDRFFSIISHDLRNNLTSMKLYFDLISNPAYSPSDTKDITKQISGSVENTIDLLENLLVWASTQIKGIPINIVRVDMDYIIEQNIKLMIGNAAHKNIQILYTNDDPFYVLADTDMINLVVRNLLSNAIKFTRDGGQIAIEISTISKEGIIAIRDNGVGIGSDNLQKLFDQHLHPSTKGTGNEKGTGLGLMLCKDFMEKNNGRIWVESEKDKGSVFSFSLPLA
jgi:two-component system, sensor histidine kinase and response regulator